MNFQVDFTVMLYVYGIQHYLGNKSMPIFKERYSEYTTRLVDIITEKECWSGLCVYNCPHLSAE